MLLIAGVGGFGLRFNPKPAAHGRARGIWAGPPAEFAAPREARDPEAFRGRKFRCGFRWEFRVFPVAGESLVTFFFFFWRAPRGVGRHQEPSRRHR